MSEILRGELSGVPLPGLLQLLESESHTGWISLGSRGGIAMAKGEVVQAAFDTLTGREAVLEWMLESEGTFRVERWNEVGESQPLGAVFSLVMEGCRLQDDWSRLRHRVMSWTAGPDTAHPQLMVLAPDGGSTLEQRVRLTGLPRAQAVHALTAAIQAGVVKTSAGSQVPDVQHSSIGIDYYQAMGSGRDLLAEGSHLAAEEAFLQALRARPGDRLATLQLNRIRVLGSALTEK